MPPFVALYLRIELNFGLQLILYCLHVLESYSNLVIDRLITVMSVTKFEQNVVRRKLNLCILFQTDLFRAVSRPQTSCEAGWAATNGELYPSLKYFFPHSKFKVFCMASRDKEVVTTFCL